MYAFQEGDRDQARALWAAKGVDAIAYDPADGHRALWDTLNAWAERARDPKAWRAGVLARAAAGPGTLAPHERGVVAHLASVPAGASEIARMGAKFSAEWLCVFDPHGRYAQPGRVGYMPDDAFFDPFAVWGLDGDPVPAPAARTWRTTSSAWSSWRPSPAPIPALTRLTPSRPAARSA